jgi:DNA-binding PadR family transcriptional regulator
MSLLDDLLAQRPDSELSGMRERLLRDQQMIPLDIAAIDRVLTARHAQSVAARQATTSTSSARPRIEAILAHGHMAPKEIASALATDGESPISDSTLYNILSRMARSGELNRVRGRYALPSQNGRIRLDAFGENTSANGSTPEAEEHESQSEGQGTRHGVEQQAFAHPSG